MDRISIALLIVIGMSAGCGNSGRLSGYKGPVSCLAVVGNDVWAGTPSGLVRYPVSGKPELFLWTGTIAGTVLVSAPDRVKPETRKQADACAGINQVRGVCAWGNGLALATAGGVAEFSIKDGKFGRIWKSTDGLGNESVRSIYSRGKQLWAATIFGASVLNASGNRWKNYDMASGLPARHTFCMAENAGKLWVSCINGGLAWFDGPVGKWRAVPQERGLGNKYIYSVDSGPEGLWLGTAGGVNLYTSRGSWDEQTCSDGYTEYCVYAIRKAGDLLWFGTAYGLYTRDIKKGGKAVTRRISGLPSDDITCIVADQGRILVGTKAGVVRIKL